MKKKKIQHKVLLACIVITLISIFATKFPFWKYSEDIYETSGDAGICTADRCFDNYRIQEGRKR